MKILFLCHRFPLPADGGGKIRALHIVRHLVEAGHNVTLCSLIRSASEAEGAHRLAGQGVRVEAVPIDAKLQFLRMLGSLVTRRPFSFAYFASPALEDTVETLLCSEAFDLIFVHCSSMAPYVIRDQKSLKIMDFADMDSRKWRDYARHKSLLAAPLFALEAKKVERWERDIARTFDRCTVISMNELESLQEIEKDASTDWFPNGVDLEYFAPPGDGAYDPEQIAFVGRMDYFPNAEAARWFCSEVWPAVRARRPSLKFKIIGADPPRSVRQLARLPGVEVTGFVPDVRPHLAPAAVTVAPLEIARGLQNKVLESMAMGVPVIVSPRVAHGLGSDEGSPLLIADSANDYVSRILSIAESRDKRDAVSRASRRYVEAHFSWAKALERLDRSIETLAAIANQATMSKANEESVPLRLRG